MIKHLQRILALVISMFLFSGCTDKEEISVATQDVFAMDTFMTLTGYGEKADEAVSAAVEEINRINSLFSVGDENSEISILNKSGSIHASEDTVYVLKEALSLYDSTDGAFDITIYPLMELWGFTTGEYRVPAAEEIQSGLNYVNASKIQLDETADILSIGDGQGVDFGAIAKGYTSDRIMDIFEKYGLVSGMVSLGGNVQCYSGKIDGTPWNCGIQDPDEPDSILCVVSVKDKAVITSGSYERFFIDKETDTTWHHIIDPSTGYPADSGLSSVTIISDRGILADGLSTSIFIMGLEQGIRYWQADSDSFDMILVTKDREIYVTEGISDSVSCDYSFHTIHP